MGIKNKISILFLVLFLVAFNDNPKRITKSGIINFEASVPLLKK